jgi:pimeloyl-ACP methyl ester carboxylesterase
VRRTTVSLRLNGKSALIVHGEPGSSCEGSTDRSFYLDGYRVVLFDQRGCGRSRPHARATSRVSPVTQSRTRGECQLRSTSVSNVVAQRRGSMTAL